MLDEPAQNGLQNIDMRAALEERYLAYALSTITQRALPDVRDGLKPVHRRLLYAMRVLKLEPNLPFKKSARVVGDVIGKYHPHGDQAVYEALVRLAQDFAERYPLIDGQGNFGNVDGDSAAAMRYTEARLTDVATLMLEGLDEDAVDFRPNYDGSEDEPVVLPGAFPNLLANGSTGIAVGMATSVPPHNIVELCDAALALLDKPQVVGDAALDLALSFVKGPDFPTGGVIVEPESVIREAYRTGRGSLRVQARWVEEAEGRGLPRAVVTEIPYLVPKARLIEKLSQWLDDKKLPLVGDIRDESSDDIRIVIEPKGRGIDLSIMMASLFRVSELESRFSFNMNVLVNGKVPQVLDIATLLRQWMDHRREVICRRSRFRLAQVDRRLLIVKGLLIVHLDLDRVIQIIREHDDPKSELMRVFGLVEEQAEAILNTRLRSLRKLEEAALVKEQTELETEQDKLQALLAQEAQQWKAVRKDVERVRKLMGPETALGRRRTTFGRSVDVNVDAIVADVEREPMTLILSQKGWLRALKGHIADASSLAFKAEDGLFASLHVQSTDKVLVFASDGKVFTLDISKVPTGRGFGDPLRLFAEMAEQTQVMALIKPEADLSLLLANSAGRGFQVASMDLLSSTKRGKQVLVPDEGTTLAVAQPCVGDHVAIVGQNRRLLAFPLSELPVMSRGRGVRLQRYKDGGLMGIRTFVRDDGLIYQNSQSGPTSIRPLEHYLGHRAEMGRTVPRGFVSL